MENSEVKQKTAQEFGKFAEQLAAEYYIKRGYTVVQRNYRQHKSEIDVIVQKDDLLVVIEVKARSGKDEDPFMAVTADKRKRMIKVADTYIRQLPGLVNYRFDLVGVTGTVQDYELEVLEDAFLSTDIFQ